MRRRWAHRAGWNEHGWTRMGFGLWMTSLLLITLTTSCSHKFPKGHLFDIMILRKLLPTSTSTTTTTPTTTPTTTVNNNKYIFLTVATYKGNFDSLTATVPGNNNGNGIDDADTLCQAQKTANFSSLPGAASEYKAFIVVGTTRRACSTADCSGGVSENIDWVLKANTDYYRLDGAIDTKIFTTNGSGIINFTAGGTLLTAIDSSSSTFWWTGMDSNWLADFSCTTPWAVTGGNANRGIGGSNNSNSIFNTYGSCNSTTQKLLCVRQ